MELIEDIVDGSTDDGAMAILRKRPAGKGDWPKIVIFHDGPGMRPATHEFAAKLASTGYDVAVPDLFHRHGRMIGFEPADREADPTVADRIWAMIASLTDDGIQHDLDVTLETFEITPTDRLGTIGFCLGARAVFRTMMRLPDQFVAGAMWHPSFLADDDTDSPHLTANQLKGDLFIGIGDADNVQPISLHRRFFDAVEPLEHVDVEVFDGADHGFTWPGYPTYDAHAASRCFERTTAMFGHVL